MDLTISAPDFVAALQVTSRMAARSAATVALSGVRIDATADRVLFEATDLELGVSWRVPATVAAPGQVLLPAGLLMEIARTLSTKAVVVLQLQDSGKVLITSGPSQWEVQTLRTEHFPPLPTLNGSQMSLPTKVFLPAIERISQTAARDQTRPILVGVHIEARDTTLRVEATDSYRLGSQISELPTKVDEPFEGIVPARALTELARLGAKQEQVQIGLDKQTVVFGLGDTVVLSSRLIAGDFPNVEQLMPTAFTSEAVLYREPTLEVVKQVGLLSTKDTALQLQFSPRTLSMSAWTAGVGKASGEVTIDYTGEPVTIGLNAAFLQEGLQLATSDTLKVGLGGALKPVLLQTTDNSGFRYLLMPIRLPANDA